MQKKKKEKTTLWDVTNHLRTEEDRMAYLGAAAAENDPILIAAVIEDIARAREKWNRRKKRSNETP